MAKFKQGDLRETAAPVFIVDEEGLHVGSAGRPLQAQLPRWHYIGGEYWDGPNNQALAIPADATVVQIAAESAKCYFEINGLSASASSSGYVPPENVVVIGPLSDLGSMRVHGAGSKVHILYFREA